MIRSKVLWRHPWIAATAWSEPIRTEVHCANCGSCVAIGTVFSLAVFLQPMSAATGWSRTGISSAMTIVFVTMGLGAFGWGALTDRFGPMIVVLSGGLLGAGPRVGKSRHQPSRVPAIYGIMVGGSRRVRSSCRRSPP